MPEYDLGTLKVVSHETSTLVEAFDIPDDRFDDIINLVKDAWKYEDTISKSIEFLVKNVKGSELVLALIFFGRILENYDRDEEES